jgi:hypothetical protein
MTRRGLLPKVSALWLGLLALPSTALAYIDPAAGSLLLQALLGGVAGILVIGKLYYRRLMGLLGRRSRDEGVGPAGGDRGSQ